MSAKKSEKQAESHAQGTCPNCGYCPHCGRSNPRPIGVWPYPQPWVYPYYPRPHGPYWTQITCGAGNQAVGGYQNDAISAASVASSN